MRKEFNQQASRALNNFIENVNAYYASNGRGDEKFRTYLLGAGTGMIYAGGLFSGDTLGLLFAGAAIGLNVGINYKGQKLRQAAEKTNEPKPE